MVRRKAGDVSIGKFDVLATYAYARGLLDGLDEAQAEERGLAAAVMGAHARAGDRGRTHHDDQADGQAAEKRRTTTITAEAFDRRVAAKMGRFFDEVFLPAMKRLVESGMSYDEVKRLLRIPSTWGAKISGERFLRRTGARPG